MIFMYYQIFMNIVKFLLVLLFMKSDAGVAEGFSLPLLCSNQKNGNLPVLRSTTKDEKVSATV
jgi:hypothetical protein